MVADGVAITPLVVDVVDDAAEYVADTALVRVVTVLVEVVPKVSIGPPWLICPMLFPTYSVNQTSIVPELVWFAPRPYL